MPMEQILDAMKLSEIAVLVGGRMVSDSDPLIAGASGLEEASSSDLTFVSRRELLPRLEESRAGAAIIAPDMETTKPSIVLEDPYAGFARFLQRFEAPLDRVFPPGIHSTALVHETAVLGNEVAIGPYSVVGPGTIIGDGCRLGAHVHLGPDVTLGNGCRLHSSTSVRERCVLGCRVVLHSGVRIGTDGFGFLPGPNGLAKIPQVGFVVLADDVEIGANSCVDRATMGQTVIGPGTKLDNMVQVGHNVKIGAHCVISGHTGIAGSCTIGDGVAMGGHVGVADHTRIGDGAQIGGKSGVIKDVPAGFRAFGLPALHVKESFRLFAAMKKLPDLLRRVAQLEKQAGFPED